MRRLLHFVKNNRTTLILSGVFLGTYLIWWLAFYPGVMSPDSLDQWRQALSKNYNDAHPFISTILLMGTFTWIKVTPAWASLMQVVAFSSVIPVILGYASKQQVNKKIIILIAIFFLIWPVFGIYTVTIWKDIIYSLALVFLAFLTFIIIYSDSPKRSSTALNTLIITTILASSFRHNGVIYLVLPYLLIAIFKKKLWKVMLRAMVIAIVSYLVLNIGLGKALNVRSAPLLVEWVRMKNVAAIYNQPSPRLSTEERNIFESFMPATAWRDTYNCRTTHNTAIAMLKYRPLGYEDNLSNDPTVENSWKRAVITAALKNPKAITKDKLCVAGNIFTSEAGFTKFETGITKRQDLPLVEEAPKLRGVHNNLVSLLQWTARTTRTNIIFWSTIPCLMLLLGYLILAIKLRLLATVSYILLILANLAFVILIGLGPDYRYVYSMIVGAPLVIPLFSIESISKKRKRAKFA